MLPLASTLYLPQHPLTSRASKPAASCKRATPPKASPGARPQQPSLQTHTSSLPPPLSRLLPTRVSQARAWHISGCPISWLWAFPVDSLSAGNDRDIPNDRAVRGRSHCPQSPPPTGLVCIPCGTLACLNPWLITGVANPLTLRSIAIG